MELTHRLDIPYDTHQLIDAEVLRFFNTYKYTDSGSEQRLVASNDDTMTTYNWIFTPTYDYCYVSKVINIPSGKTGKVTLPEPGMGVVLSNPISVFNVYTSGGTFRVDGVPYWVLDNMTTRANVEVTIEGGNTAYIISKSREALEGLQIDIITSTPYTLIDEPIGFDSLEMKMQRNDYHGIGAAFSVDSLEFYNLAYDVIKSCYEEDIDKIVTYNVLDGEEVFYSGVLDLSTCLFSYGDYKSVKLKVGDIGAKTIFNNRTDKEVDLDAPKTIDGASVDVPDWLSLHIPMKHLLYTDKAKRTSDILLKNADGEYQNYSPDYISLPIPTAGIRWRSVCIAIPIGVDINTEFGSLTPIARPYVEFYERFNINPQYVPSESHTTDFGNNTIANLDIRALLTIRFFISENNPASHTYFEFYARITAKSLSGTEIQGEEVKLRSYDMDSQGNVNFICNLKGQLPAGESIKYFVELYNYSGSDTLNDKLWLTVKKGSYVKITMYDTLPETNVEADMLLIHDALNIVSHAISENALAVKSDWYCTPESHWNPSSMGGGGLKALTNGYKIRGLFTESDNKRNMPLSFKNIIESLSALDCIGWGFSKENGELCVRVERWDWFYKDDVILTLTDVAEINVDIDKDHIPTELKIGYKKYATQDQYNSIDSPHGTRTFVNGIKALSNKITKESEFIADNYAIEETRRARAQLNETEESTYDENIFIFELIKKGNEYLIGHTAVNAENVGNSDEFINAKLTPHHMAYRWWDYLFATNNITPFRFNAGEINYKALFGVIPTVSVNGGIITFSLHAIGADQLSPQEQRAENEDIPYKPAKFKAEKITFSYPITLDQYRAVLDNPYGVIEAIDASGKVHKGWIMDFKYKLTDGMADFTLLAKY